MSLLKKHWFAFSLLFVYSTLVLIIASVVTWGERSDLETNFCLKNFRDQRRDGTSDIHKTFFTTLFVHHAIGYALGNVWLAIVWLLWWVHFVRKQFVRVLLVTVFVALPVVYFIPFVENGQAVHCNSISLNFTAGGFILGAMLLERPVSWKQVLWFICCIGGHGVFLEGVPALRKAVENDPHFSQFSASVKNHAYASIVGLIAAFVNQTYEAVVRHDLEVSEWPLAAFRHPEKQKQLMFWRNDNSQSKENEMELNSTSSLSYIDFESVESDSE